MLDKQTVLKLNMDELTHAKRHISKTRAHPNASTAELAGADKACAWIEQRETQLERWHLKQCVNVPTQVCTTCGKKKPIDDSPFGFGIKSTGTPKRKCKSCYRAYNVAYHVNDPERGRARATLHQEKRPLKFTLSHAMKSLLRKAQGDCCAYCGTDLIGGGELDHWIPIERGGKDSAYNLVWACRNCNRGKGRKLPEDFREVLVARGKRIRAGGFFAPRKNLRELRLEAARRDAVQDG